MNLNTDNNEGMRSDWINFVLVGDNNYMLQLSVVMTSILLNLKSGRKARFFVFVSAVDPAETARFNELKEIGECEIVIVDMAEYEHYFESLATDAFQLKYVTFATYYRLMMLSILPDDVEKCFYIDGDMIVDGDLSEIYDSLRNSCLAKVVVDVHSMQHRHALLPHLYVLGDFAPFTADPLQAPYFNAGFFLLNVKLAKELKCFEAALDFLKRVPNPPYADQDMLNAVLGQAHRDKIEFLDPAYNVFCDIDYDIMYDDAYYPQEAIKTGFKSPKVCHYAGGAKPWQTRKTRHHWKRWMYYYARSPFWDVPVPVLKAVKDKRRGRFRLAHIVVQKNKWEIRLFKSISFFKIRQRSDATYWLLFYVLTLNKVVEYKRENINYLFGLIPLLWVRKRSKNEWVAKPG